MQLGEKSHNQSKGQTKLAGNSSSRSVMFRAKKILTVLVFILMVFLFIFLGGFIRFAEMVSALVPPENPKADGIVVLTGGSQRLVQAVELLQAGAAERLLVSGVHPMTSSTQIRKMTRGSEALFTCCVDIGHKALDTIGNAYEAVGWIKSHKYKRVLIVTNNYHMPRSLYELQILDPKTEYIAYPVVNSDLKDRNWLSNNQALRMMIGEYLKLSYAVVRDSFGISTEHGLRAAPPKE